MPELDFVLFPTVKLDRYRMTPTKDLYIRSEETAFTMEAWIKRIRPTSADEDDEEKVLFEHQGAMKVFFQRDLPDYLTV